MLESALKIPRTEKQSKFIYKIGSLNELKNGNGILLSGGFEEARDELYIGGIIGVYQEEHHSTKFNLGFHPQLIHLAGISDEATREYIDPRIAISSKNWNLPKFESKKTQPDLYSIFNIQTIPVSFKYIRNFLLKQQVTFGLTFEEYSFLDSCKKH